MLVISKLIAPTMIMEYGPNFLVNCINSGKMIYNCMIREKNQNGPVTAVASPGMKLKIRVSFNNKLLTVSALNPLSQIGMTIIKKTMINSKVGYNFFILPTRKSTKDISLFLLEIYNP
jgi:hypothetical protein